MSSYFSKQHEKLIPYTPGEQPKDKSCIKLNTNELPYPASPLALKLARQAAEDLNLYPDPDSSILRKTAAEVFQIREDQILFTNGSDEALNYALMAYCDKDVPLVFPDVTYSFYKVIADLNHVSYTCIPVKEDLSIDIHDYLSNNATILIANPNAPSGLSLSNDDIETILKANPDHVLILDEAYGDFNEENAIPLISKYENLLIVRTFSKSYGMAGARLGYMIANGKLIEDINTLRNSNNPYCVDRMAMMAGVGALRDQSYLNACVTQIKKTRAETKCRLEGLGFAVLNSSTNFLFAKHPSFDGRKLYLDLKENGILVRHFNTERLHEFIRISIGTDEQMDVLIKTLKTLLEENDANS